jgi:protein involved in polysaccharide export with SLBB domain
MQRVTRGVTYFYEERRDDIDYRVEKVVDLVKPPRFYPLVGPAQLHLCRWRVTVFYTETIEASYPFPFQVKRRRSEVVYIDTDHLHQCEVTLSGQSSLISDLTGVKIAETKPKKVTGDRSDSTARARDRSASGVSHSTTIAGSVPPQLERLNIFGGDGLSDGLIVVEEPPPVCIQPPDIVSLSISDIAKPAAKQQLDGEHLVRPDGTVSLGTYGRVRVADLTVSRARDAIRKHLAKYLLQVKVDIELVSYNSRYFYIVDADSAVRLPWLAPITVRDALKDHFGTADLSGRKIWIARPVGQRSRFRLLPVDWKRIAREPASEANHRVLPGDRIYVDNLPRP